MEEGSGQRKEELFHVIHKVPQGDTPYVKAKHAQVSVAFSPLANLIHFSPYTVRFICCVLSFWL